MFGELFFLVWGFYRKAEKQGSEEADKKKSRKARKQKSREAGKQIRKDQSKKNPLTKT